MPLKLGNFENFLAGELFIEENLPKFFSGGPRGHRIRFHARDDEEGKKVGVTIDDIIKVYEQGDERVIRTISTLLNALADSAAKGKPENRELKELKESVQKQGRKIQKQESQIEELKSMLGYTGQDLKDIIAALNEIIEKDTPPDPGNERRTSMITLAHLLKQAQERINHRGRPGTALEDEEHSFTKA